MVNKVDETGLVYNVKNENYAATDESHEKENKQEGYALQYAQLKH